MATVVLLLPRVFKVSLLIDGTYKWNCVPLIVSSFGQIEQSAHYIRKYFIYSTRKAFLESTVVELVYKFDEKYIVV